GEEFLRSGDIDFAFVFLHQLLPALVAGIAAQPSVFQVGVGFFGGEVRAKKVVFGGEEDVRFSVERDIFQAQLEAGNFILFRIGDKPIVRVAAVVAFLEGARDIVDGSGILHGLASADKFGDAVEVIAGKAGDGSFGDDDAGSVDAEVV